MSEREDYFFKRRFHSKPKTFIKWDFKLLLKLYLPSKNQNNINGEIPMGCLLIPDLL